MPSTCVAENDFFSRETSVLPLHPYMYCATSMPYAPARGVVLGTQGGEPGTQGIVPGKRSC